MTLNKFHPKCGMIQFRVRHIFHHILKDEHFFFVSARKIITWRFSWIETNLQNEILKMHRKLLQKLKRYQKAQEKRDDNTSMAAFRKHITLGSPKRFFYLRKAKLTSNYKFPWQLFRCFLCLSLVFQALCQHFVLSNAANCHKRT